MQGNLLFNSILLIFYFLSFTFQSSIPFPEDEQCEKIGSIIMKHIIDKSPLPEEYKEAYKLLKYSGSGLNDMGDYYACKTLPFSNFYTITISISGMSQTMGLCFLKDCSREYIQNSIYDLYDYLNISLSITKENIVVSDSDVTIADVRKDYKIGFYIVLSVLSILVIICLISSIGKIKVLESFDVEKNIKTIFSVHNQNNVLSHLRIFDGIRFLSAGWVVFGHTCFVPLLYGIKNTLEIYYQSKEWYFPFITSAYFSVDVFFYLSGFLFNFSVQKYFDKSIPRLKIIIVSIVLRYIRLLPFLLVGIFGFIYITPFLSNGPNMTSYIFANRGCVNNYWHNLLYINNLINYSYTDINYFQCAGHFWYLACDMQFFIGSILIVVLLNNQKIIRHIILILILISSCIIQMYLVLTNNYQYNDLAHANGTFNDYFLKFYITPYARIIPYIIGMYFCELFLETDLYKNEYNKKEYQKVQNKEESTDTVIDIEAPKDKVSPFYRLNKYIQNNNWFAFLLFVIALICINFFFWTSAISNKNELSVLSSALFNTFGKMFFVFGLGIIVHLTLLDKFTFIRTILTFKIETAVSRSTYGIYVIHFYFILFFTYAYDTFYYIQFYDMIFLAVGLFIFSWILSLIIGLIVESPIIAISKKLLRSGEGKKNNK